MTFSDRQMRALIVGFGSIGQRHADILTSLGLQVSAVTGNQEAAVPRFASIADAIAGGPFDYTVIASSTARHMSDIQALAGAGFEGAVLVEKPINENGQELPDNKFRQVCVGYNLRFHPLLQELRHSLSGEAVQQITIHCGQHLADWRPGRDFRTTYSADQAQGGGVLRDLSHELDYLLWLFGPWKRVAAIGGNLGVLDIDADEAWSILLEMESGAVATVTVNYFDRPAKRSLQVTTANNTLCVDMIQNSFAVGGEPPRDYVVDRNMTYQSMHTAILSGDRDHIATARDGQAVMGLINAIEQAAQKGEWVKTCL